ncbi:MAG: tetratricopeptide (TPR) repeat protein [Bacteroidia bacterium]|jgi:tetratricopeptide (TPR) repeat protein
MKSLLSLVKVLRSSEKRLLLHYYSRNTNSEEKLRLKLFRLVVKGVETDAEARLLLKTKGGPSAYSHLKSRLKDDILNVLLTQDTSKRLAQGNRSAELDCRKKVAQSHLLLLRGARIEGINVLTKALKTATQYELLAERLQIHHLLREKFLGAGSTIELTRLNEEIDSDMRRYQSLLYVEQQSFVLSSPEFAKNLGSKSKEAEHTELIEELGTLFKVHKLARIGFWYYMAATEFHSSRGRFDEVVTIGAKFLSLVEKNPAVKSKNNIAGVNLSLGTANLKLRNYEKAQVHLVRSESLFPASGFNRLTCLQHLVLAEAACKKYDSALNHIELASRHSRISTREALIPRWLYLKACVEFLNGDVDASFKSLNRDGYLLKQQDTWNIQFRLLELMQLIEQQDVEWLEFKLDATRKFLTRHKILDSNRVRTAINVFGNLVRKDLDFDEISEKNMDSLKSCLKEEKGFAWDPTGSEIVRFDEWVASKTSKLNEGNSREQIEP